MNQVSKAVALSLALGLLVVAHGVGRDRAQDGRGRLVEASGVPLQCSTSNLRHLSFSASGLTIRILDVQASSYQLGPSFFHKYYYGDRKGLGAVSIRVENLSSEIQAYVPSKFWIQDRNGSLLTPMEQQIGKRSIHPFESILTPVGRMEANYNFNTKLQMPITILYDGKALVQVSS